MVWILDHSLTLPEQDVESSRVLTALLLGQRFASSLWVSCTWEILEGFLYVHQCVSFKWWSHPNMTYIKLGMMDFKNLRILFGPDEVQKKLKASKLSMDMWFTGGDFAGVAATQLQTAIRRRFLSLTWTGFVIYIYIFFCGGGYLCVELPSGDQSFWNQCLWAISSQVWFRSGLACWACVWHCRPLKEVARNEIEQMFLAIFFYHRMIHLDLATWFWLMVIVKGSSLTIFRADACFRTFWTLSTGRMWRLPREDLNLIWPLKYVLLFFINFNVCVVIVFFIVCLLMFCAHFFVCMFVGMLAGC